MNSIVSYKKNEEGWLIILAHFVSSTLFLLWLTSFSYAGSMTYRNFSSAQDAVTSLVIAVRANDMEEMIAILGPGSRELVFSGDDVADRTERKKFLKAYDRMNMIQKVSADKATLCIGKDNWPLPIPIVKTDLKKWVFDAEQGKQEILNRRIGRNELHVMEVLHAYTEAQHEYASRDCGGSGVVEFAQKIISAPGKCDGLYWEVKDGEKESPLGPLVARAAKEGYADANLSPFHGYYFKILKGQGKHAQGGAYDYVVKGKMLLGFALVAYPAEYGNSGVTTFIVNQEGIVYEKDLGVNTTRTAEKMKIFNPDKTWKRVKETLSDQDK
jgi:hypothetical protein